MRVLVVNIHRSELTNVRAVVAPWELPLLQAVHGHQNVTVKGEVDNDRAYPSRASEEYSRLDIVYGDDKDEGTRYIHGVYGKDVGGHMQLGNAIRRAINDAKTKPLRPVPPEPVAGEDEFGSPDLIDSAGAPGGAADPDVIDAGQPAAPVAEKDPLLG